VVSSTAGNTKSQEMIDVVFSEKVFAILKNDLRWNRNKPFLWQLALRLATISQTMVSNWYRFSCEANLVA
jgi:hypothetical protein